MSIDAKELRIGNTMLWGNKPVHISSISEICIGVDAGMSIFGKATLQPIPLTPSILVDACGFEKYMEETGPPINDELEIYDSGQISFFFDNYGALILNGFHYNMNRPKYLHQLQNLYFALTGEELPIDISKLKTEKTNQP